MAKVCQFHLLVLLFFPLSFILLFLFIFIISYMFPTFPKTFLVWVNSQRIVMSTLNFILCFVLLNLRVLIKSFFMAWLDRMDYHFPNLLPQPSTFPLVNSVWNTVSDSSTFLLWHSRLGHLIVDTLRVVLNSYNVPVHNEAVKDFCISCCMGKSHRLPSSSSTFYTAPL